MAEPDRSEEERNLAAQRYLAKQDFSDDLIQVYHAGFLARQLDSAEGFAPVTRKSDQRHQNNIRSLKRSIAYEYEQALDKDLSVVSGELSNFRQSALSPHLAKLPLVQAESWQPSHCEAYTLLSFLEGFAEQKGYYLITRNGLEHFAEAAAHCVLASGSEGVEFPRFVSGEDFGSQVIMTKAAFEESRARLKPFEEPQANIVQDAVLNALVRVLGVEQVEVGVVREHFKTAYCTPDKYAVELNGHPGRSFELDIHLHAAEQSVMATTPLALLAAIRGLEL